MTPPGSTADRERVLLLECRLEQMRSALDEAREDADRARTKLAEAAAREADHARRYSLIQQELAEARADVAFLHRHLERSEALRAELAGQLFEGGAREDADELIRLRQKVLSEDQRAMVSERTVARLRDRVEELAASRETLLTRIAEWQQLVREDGREAVDLSEFLAELRRDILELEHHSVTSDAREAVLRERLARAGIDPDAGPGDTVPVPALDAREYLDSVEAEDSEAEAVEEPTAEELDELAGSADLAASSEDADSSEVAGPDGVVAPSEADLPFDEAALTELAAAADVAGASEAAADTGGAVPSEEAAGTDIAASSEPAVAPEVAAPSEADVVSELAAVDPAAALAAAASVEPTAPRRRSERADERPDLGEAAAPPMRAPARPSPPSGRVAGLIAELEQAGSQALQTALLLRIGRSGDAGAAEAIRPWTESPEPSVRAAAYEALGHLLERAPEALERHLRAGLADRDARVRRRVALAAATARGVSLRELLDPLREDADAQVRRVVREVLRRAPSNDAPTPAGQPRGGAAPAAEAATPAGPEGGVSKAGRTASARSGSSAAGGGSSVRTRSRRS